LLLTTIVLDAPAARRSAPIEGKEAMLLLTSAPEAAALAELEQIAKTVL